MFASTLNAMGRGRGCPSLRGAIKLIQQQKRSLTTTSALQLLGLCPNSKVSAKNLRQAYLLTAKKCHPDLKQHDNIDLDFREVTEAYEFLQTGVSPIDDLGITLQEEESYRQACDDWLGVRAEVVEESKRCPVFRNWLEGKTDAAIYWNNFFALHGGLAPCLRPPSALIEKGGDAGVNTFERRRRR